jgi:uncharacterized protein (TIGR03437 family)
MKQIGLIRSIFLLPMLPCAVAQTGPTLVDLSYGLPYQLKVAPGQLVTFNLTGLDLNLSGPVRANQTPLPTVLAGISITLNQSTAGGPVSLRVPLLSVRQANRCADTVVATADCYVTMISGQIPFEMTVLSDGLPSSDVVISENGTNSQHFSVGASLDNIHIVTGTDSLGNNCGGACVTHADGSLVTRTSPGTPGEVIVIYAYGLGKTNPAVPTGQPTPAPAPVAANPVYVQFDFTPNAGPKYPFQLIASTPPAATLPEFAGLTPGEVGLYQVNVRLPETFPAVPSCAGSPSGLPTINSNLTIDITDGNGSIDAAPICVQPQQ